ncbi:MAG: PKD domain-containing protein [Thermoproteota archaeon]|nr:PKD domain-containing protein [Thermoproteota archaeon]
MINHWISPNIGIVVLTVSLFSYSIFSGLVTTTSPSSFPWNSALAQVDGNDTQDQSQVPGQDGEPPTQPPTNDTGGVEPEPLTVQAQWDSQDGDTAPATFLFEAFAEGGTEPYTYQWDFGDSQQSDEAFADHTYDNPGTYDATVTVTDATGQTASDTTSSIQVIPAPTTEPPPTNVTTPPTNVTTNQTGGNQSEVSNRISVQIQPPGCTSISDAEHWNKIVFRITSDPTGRIDSSLINTELEILERVNDGAVLNVKDIVRYSIVNEPGTLLPQLTFDEVEQLEIEILDVEYALICFRQ